MSESSRLEALRFLEKVQLRDLERTRRWIAMEEGRTAETATRQPPPEWVVERRVEQKTVHVGDCWVAGKKAQPITREQAVAAFTEHGAQPCDVCRPDTALGVLD
ncbi:DUF6233 domain-containing protein [Streptomyces sp. NPDC102274]|uniref:DUF6233 domain-containing protein n=1 Tax=Streptomyces sp. NPDC102274 TaxID=3366151 RepID=UPI00381D620D